MKHDHNAGVWKIIGVRLGFTAEEHTRTELIRQKSVKSVKTRQTESRDLSLHSDFHNNHCFKAALQRTLMLMFITRRLCGILNSDWSVTTF